jgi:methyl-accepting chemotaxis protein
MKRISTGLKIILAFFVIAMIFGFVGFMGSDSISKINANGDLLYNNNTMAIAYSGDAALAFEQMRIGIMQLGIVTEEESRSTCIKNIESNMASVDDLLTQYEGTITSSENRELFDSLQKGWKKYKGYVESSIGYCKQNPSLDLSRYTSEFVLKQQDLSDSIAETFSKTLTLNKEIARSVNEQNGSFGESTTLLIMVLVASGIVVAAILGVIIGRSVSKTVRRTSQQLRKIANGEDVDDLDVKKFSGEFINIAQNLNDVQASLQRMLKDAKALANAGIEGQLSTRADLSEHTGSFRAIIEGFNRSLDAFTAPIQEIVDVLKEMQKGRLSVSVTGEYPGDYADIKNALNDTITTIKGYVEEVSLNLENMAQGNLTGSIETEYRGDFITLRDSINMIIDSFNRLLKEILLAANQVASGTRQVSDGSQAIATGATEQAGAIEQLTSTITHITEQTKLNAQHADKTKALSTEVRSNAKDGDIKMDSMQHAMTVIKESSENISQIIKVIDDIAFQTNILALNAAVEAARAGVHGRGFAVVAEEVRNLAARSAKAASETTVLIENSVQRVQQGMQIADETARSLRKIVEGVDDTVALVSHIADASNKQASAITQINSGIDNLSDVVQNNSATSEETAAAAQELSSQAETLKSMVMQFELRQTEILSSESYKEQDKKALSEIQNVLNEEGFGKY